MKYFKLTEFETNGVKVTNDTIQHNIVSLVDNLLDKVRTYYGKAVYVTEGYNPNSIYNGNNIGVGANITTKSKQGNIDIFEYIKTLDFDDLSVIGDYETIHVSYYPKNRKIVVENEDSKEFLSDYIVCIDSGHGKDVAGKRSPDSSLLEWQWARDVKYRIINKLEQDKIALCYDVNPEDTEPGLTVRANRANAVHKENNKKSIFVSIHVNAAGNGQWMNARGWSIYTSKGQTEADILATDIWNEANAIFTPKGLTMRKEMSDGDVDYESNFTVLVKTSAPAVLIENFFMDNKEDVKYLLSEEGKNNVVTAIVNGITKYLKNKI